MAAANRRSRDAKTGGDEVQGHAQDRVSDALIVTGLIGSGACRRCAGGGNGARDRGDRNSRRTGRGPACRAFRRPVCVTRPRWCSLAPRSSVLRRPFVAPPEASRSADFGVRTEISIESPARTTSRVLSTRNAALPSRPCASSRSPLRCLCWLLACGAPAASHVCSCRGQPPGGHRSRRPAMCSSSNPAPPMFGNFVLPVKTGSQLHHHPDVR